MNFKIYIDGEPMHEFCLDTRALTDEQIDRLVHHATKVSPVVFQASVLSMLKGVQKYGPEPEMATPKPVGYLSPALGDVMRHWLPHIFSEGVDAANQTGLLADTLGVEVLPHDP